MSGRYIHGALVLALVTTLAAACGGDDGSGTDASDPTAEPTAGAPSAERTGIEQPAPGGNEPAIDIAGAPAGEGGATPNDDGSLCVDVRWLGGQDEANLGGGIAFEVTEVRLTGAEPAGSSCPDDPCQGFTFDSNSDNCVHAVRPGEAEGTLSLYGRVRCSAPAQECADFRSRLRERSIPVPAAQTGDAESEEPTPTQEQTDTDDPAPTGPETPGADDEPSPAE